MHAAVVAAQGVHAAVVAAQGTPVGQTTAAGANGQKYLAEYELELVHHNRLNGRAPQGAGIKAAKTDYNILGSFD